MELLSGEWMITLASVNDIHCEQREENENHARVRCNGMARPRNPGVVVSMDSKRARHLLTIAFYRTFQGLQLPITRVAHTSEI